MMRSNTATGSVHRFASAVWLENTIGWRRFRFLTLVSFLLSSLFFACFAVVHWLLPLITNAASLGQAASKWLLALSFVFAGMFLLVGAIYSYFLFYRLETTENSIEDQPVSYSAGELLLAIDEADDLARGLLASSFGKRVLVRAGAAPQNLYDRQVPARVPREFFASLQQFDVLDLETIFESLYESSPELEEFLFSSGITKETFLESAHWVAHTNRRLVKARRWWSHEHLSQVEPIGQTFAYGRAYTLEKFTKSVSDERVFSGAEATSDAFAQELQKTYNILTRPQGANALLVGESTGGVADIIASIRADLRADSAPKPLNDFQLKVLDGQMLLTAAETKPHFQKLFQKILVEAVTAGNILLVLENFPRFQEETERIGVNLVSLLEPVLPNPALPLIFTSSVADYHHGLEGTSLMSELGAVHLHEIDDSALLDLLGEVAVGREGDSVCTIGALKAAIRSGRQVIADDQMPHAAVSLLLEIISTHPETYITHAVVEEYVSDKTGVPTGAVSRQERKRLTNLEERLGERVVGQKRALTEISASLRRNRSGVGEKDRPIGSFLLLGPTGVGKTQTAKTLNETYFEGKSMRRLDMSEYSGTAAVDRLRGAAGETGRLADMVREQPYGVLLLDEFEKAAREVHDLFLQIFDEGYFTDGAGNRVNLENLILIATSNAGAQQIFKRAEAGEDVSGYHDELITGLIDSGIFRPELLNRFDATILYHPLSVTELEKVTRILLSELAARLRERGIKVSFSDRLVEKIAREGNNPEFGARAIRRVIQNRVEDVLADKIISEEVEVGQSVRMRTDDLTIT